LTFDARYVVGGCDLDFLCSERHANNFQVDKTIVEVSRSFSENQPHLVASFITLNHDIQHLWISDHIWSFICLQQLLRAIRQNLSQKNLSCVNINININTNINIKIKLVEFPKEPLRCSHRYVERCDMAG
jgi:hypothetical protein